MSCACENWLEVEEVESLVPEMMDMDVEPEVVEMEVDSASDGAMVGMEWS